MDSRRNHTLRLQVSIAILCIFLAASNFFPPCDARSHGRAFHGPKIIHRTSTNRKKLKSLNRLDDINSPLMGFSSSENPYGSPSSQPLPPFNSLAPQPTTPSASESPYSSFTPPNLPYYSPVVNAPYYNAPPPPEIPQSPSPPKSGPSPPQVYLPPLVYPPPPTASMGWSPPPHTKPQYANWCVAKPTVPDPIIQEAMDYACGSGADCKSIQTNGPCYQPNTMLAHASYAFNSYWQNTKVGGGTCDFGGTAMLVTVDPSFDKCHFMLT